MCLAKKITDKKNQMFVLSGILAFADKIIDARTAEQIKEDSYDIGCTVIIRRGKRRRKNRGNESIY